MSGIHPAERKQQLETERVELWERLRRVEQEVEELGPSAQARTDKARSAIADEKRESGSPGGGKGRKDDVPETGVYPMSGPLPVGDAKVRGQMEWGQGSRGAAGYYDHGDSEVINIPPQPVMTTSAYGFGISVPWSQPEAIDRVTAALKEEGFGVITTIDVQETLEEKLGIGWSPYAILGACNPQLAYRALQAEPEIGLLLPCNVIVYENQGMTVVSAMDPEAALALSGSPALEPIAREAKARLQRALGKLSGAQST